MSLSDPSGSKIERWRERFLICIKQNRVKGKRRTAEERPRRVHPRDDVMSDEHGESSA